MFSTSFHFSKISGKRILPKLNMIASINLLQTFMADKNFQIRLLSTHESDEKCYELVIVGGGIVGLAVAQELKTRMPSLCVALVEKEKKLAAHQSGNNSGVIHAGVYYKPGTLRAKLCVEGLHRTYKYCDKHKIPYKKCGKLIVATNELEVTLLNDLYERSLANNVPDVKLVSSVGIRSIEPFCKGLKAIHSPHTGIVDWAVVARKYGSEFQRMGGDIHLSFEVTSFDIADKESGPDQAKSDYPITVHDNKSKKSLRTAYVLTCGGLYSDKLAKMTGGSIEPKIIPFRGEYLKLKKEKEYLCKGNIYPVPDPRFPFLGVHYTPRMDGAIWLGPNAMLAFRKEGYRFWDINLKELFETLTYPGFQKFIFRHIKNILVETKKSFIRKDQVLDLQKYIPEVTISDIEKGPSGVRAQAMSLNGELVDDFVFSGEGRILHCRNAPSPGATSSLAIGRELADRVQNQFKLC